MKTVRGTLGAVVYGALVIANALLAVHAESHWLAGVAALGAGFAGFCFALAMGVETK